MNHQDPRDENDHSGMNQRLERIIETIRRSWSAGRSWLAVQKDRLAARFKAADGNGGESVRPRRNVIRPKRIDTHKPDLIAARPSVAPARPALKRIDATESARTSSQEPSLDDEPDRTYEKSAHSDRPDLRHVTRGNPELVEDTAVHPIIDDSMLTDPSADLSAEAAPASEKTAESAGGIVDATQPRTSEPVAEIQADSTEDLDKTAVRPDIRNRSVKESAPTTLPPISARSAASVKLTEQAGPVRAFMEQHFPDLLQFLDSYRKRRKADRSIRRNSRERVYRLKGYTTVAKVNRKRQSEKRQRLLRRVLISIIALLTLILLFQLYNPFKDLTEWYRILGVDSFSELIENPTATGTSNPSNPSGTFQTVITSPTTSGARTTTAAAAPTTATTKSATSTAPSATTVRR